MDPVDVAATLERANARITDLETQRDELLANLASMSDELTRAHERIGQLEHEIERLKRSQRVGF